MKTYRPALSKYFWLQVESGRIDHSLHLNKPVKFMAEIMSMDKAVAAALEVFILLSCISVVMI